MKVSRKELKKQLRDGVDFNDDGMSYDEIATVLGISKAEVRRIEYQALKKLKQPTETNKKVSRYFFG